MAKTETWPVRLTLQGFDKACTMMKDFGYRGRDIFAEDALSVLAAVKVGAKLPDCIDVARRRHQQIMIERKAKEFANVATEATKQDSQHNSSGQPSSNQAGNNAGNSAPHLDDRR